MTTNKSKEEKRMMFFDMQEHPDHYTDEQMEALLADDEMKEFFHDMAMARMAGKKAHPQKVNVEEAWKEFSTKHSLGDSEGKLSLEHSNGNAPMATSERNASSNRFKIAASIIGVVFLSGITFAAIHSGIFHSSSSEDTPQPKLEQTSLSTNTIHPDSTQAKVAEKADSLNLKPVVFDNAELGEVVSQLAAFYHVKAEFENAASQHIRIFFNWDKKKTLQQNLEILNAFERIQITEENGILKVE